MKLNLSWNPMQRLLPTFDGISGHSLCFTGRANRFKLSARYEACTRIFLLFAITVFHTDQFLWSLAPFLLVMPLVLVTKKNKNILSDVFFSLIKN